MPIANFAAAKVGTKRIPVDRLQQLRAVAMDGISQGIPSYRFMGS
jgi:hypothetical protein